MMRQDQALELAAMLYEAFSDLSDGELVGDQLLLLAQAIEANEVVPGGIDLRAFVNRHGNPPTRPARLRVVR